PGDRPRLLERRPGEAAIRGELEPDELGVETADGGAAQDATLAVEEITVGGVGVEELRHLVDEPLQDDVDIELAGHHLRRLQQRALMLEAAPVHLRLALERRRERR